MLFAGVLITVLWAPIPFGSIEPWAVGIVQVAAFLLVAIWVLACGARGVVVAQRNPLQLVVLALAALAFVQSFAILPSGPTSVDPFSSRQAGTTIFALGCLFAVALVSIDSRRRVETAANALFWLGFGLSVLGILQSVSGAQKIYWFRETNGNLLFGPFPNKNHFAGLMELLLPLGLGMLATGAVPRQRRGLYLFGALVICIAVVLSRSRGGLLSLVAELVFLVAAAAFAFRSPRRGRSGNPAVVGVGALILAAAVAVGRMRRGRGAARSTIPGPCTTASSIPAADRTPRSARP